MTNRYGTRKEPEILEMGRGYVAAVRTDVITLEIDLDKRLT